MLSALLIGKEGEDKVARMLTANNFNWISDIYLPSYHGSTNQLDFVVPIANDLLVLEVKNMKGRIEGHEDDHWWNVVNKTRRDKQQIRKFYNPILQNCTHIRNIRKQMKSAPRCFNMVVFVHPKVDIMVETDEACTLMDLPFFLQTLPRNYEEEQESLKELLHIKDKFEHLSFSHLKGN